MAGDAALGVDEVHGLAGGAHAHAPRDVRGRHGDVDFLIRTEALLEPAAIDGLQRAVFLEFADGVIDLRQKCCVALAHGDRGVVEFERLGQDLQGRVLFGHLEGGRETGDDSVEFPGVQGRHRVHHVLEGLHVGLREPLPGDGFAGRASHDTDPGVRSIVDHPDVHGGLFAADQDQRRAHEGRERPCSVCHA